MPEALMILALGAATVAYAIFMSRAVRSAQEAALAMADRMATLYESTILSMKDLSHVGGTPLEIEKERASLERAKLEFQRKHHDDKLEWAKTYWAQQRPQPPKG